MGRAAWGAERETCSLRRAEDVLEEQPVGPGRSSCRGESQREEEVGIAFVHVNRGGRGHMGEKILA